MSIRTVDNTELIDIFVYGYYGLQCDRIYGDMCVRCLQLFLRMVERLCKIANNLRGLLNDFVKSTWHISTLKCFDVKL